MADLQVTDTGTVVHPPVNAATFVYLMFGIAVVGTLLSSGLAAFAPLFGIAGIVGVIVAYAKRGDAQGTWVASHLAWLIRTFWWSLLWDIIAVLLFITLIGIPVAFVILVATSIWGIYRVTRGLLAFKDSAPIPGA